jgi:hypothetical protein
VPTVLSLALPEASARLSDIEQHVQNVSPYARKPHSHELSLTIDERFERKKRRQSGETIGHARRPLCAISLAAKSARSLSTERSFGYSETWHYNEERRRRDHDVMRHAFSAWFPLEDMTSRKHSFLAALAARSGQKRDMK